MSEFAMRDEEDESEDSGIEDGFSKSILATIIKDKNRDEWKICD